ncbi:hypothetical protein D3C83_46710 [compost metagenome]
MKHDTADHLHVEVPHPERAFRGFAHGGEGFRQDVVERLALRELLAELGGLRSQLGV